LKNALQAPCDQVKEFLAELVERLDELDEQDYFGHKGWRSELMGE
jgi:hypothetical protein